MQTTPPHPPPPTPPSAIWYPSIQWVKCTDVRDFQSWRRQIPYGVIIFCHALHVYVHVCIVVSRICRRMDKIQIRRVWSEPKLCDNRAIFFDDIHTH